MAGPVSWAPIRNTLIQDLQKASLTQCPPALKLVTRKLSGMLLLTAHFLSLKGEMLHVVLHKTLACIINDNCYFLTALLLSCMREKYICREKYRVSAQDLNMFGCRWEVLVPLDSSCDILHCHHIMYLQKTEHVIKGECQVVGIRPRGEKHSRFGNTQPNLRLLDLSIVRRNYAGSIGQMTQNIK